MIALFLNGVKKFFYIDTDALVLEIKSLDVYRDI